MTAALINAGSLALLQASSIPLIGTVVAVAVGMKQVSQEKQLILDPEDRECEHLIGGGVFAFLFSRSHDDLASLNPMEHENGDVSKGRVVWSSWDGVFDLKEYAKAEEMARTSGAEIFQLFRRIMSSTDETDSMAVD